MSTSIALCIPAFKAETFLPTLLASALSQDPPFSEIIVCVDASPDGTAEVARSFGVTVVVNPTNLGCSGSKNVALRRVNSDWVHFHDADDELLPNFTRVASEIIQRSIEFDVVAMGFEYREAKTNKLLARSSYDVEQLENDPVRYCIRHKIPNFGLYRVEKLRLVNGFDIDPQVLYNEDVAFHLKLALSGFRFSASDEVTSINWRHSQSMSSSNELKCLLAHARVMSNAASVCGDLYGEEIAERLWCAATGLAVYSQWKKVDELLKEALVLWPHIPKGQSRLFRCTCKTVGIRFAYRIREHAIRWFKPKLRKCINI